MTDWTEDKTHVQLPRDRDNGFDEPLTVPLGQAPTSDMPREPCADDEREPNAPDRISSRHVPRWIEFAEQSGELTVQIHCCICFDGLALLTPFRLTRAAMAKLQ